jgi:parallel beta-helix repeat protein/predicted outer membrane repeat protein
MFSRFLQRSYGKSRSLRNANAGVRRLRNHLDLETLEDRLALSVFNVNSTADILCPPTGVVTLRSAIQMANQTPGDNTINLTVAGTYQITIPTTGADDNTTGEFAIIPNADSPAGSTITIQNASGGKVIVDGNHIDRVFDINPDDIVAPAPFTVVMQGFTIQNGIAQPGDAAQGSGGGIRDQGNVSLTLTNMTVTDNSATADGGGVSMENAATTSWTLTINNSKITNNHAGDAGGGLETDGSGTDLINAGTVISGNTCVNQGAGIWLDAIQVGDTFQGAFLTVSGAVITGNKALSTGGVGGGIGNAGDGPVTILNSTLANNFAGEFGGGFGDENAQGSLTVLNSSFLNNTTVGIGGGIASGGPVTILNSTVANNFAGATGGGFGDENAQDSLSATNSTFLNNTATGNGGGIAVSGTLTSLSNTEIDGNVSGGTGGGVFANGITLTLQSCTLASNTASGDGGGIELETSGAGSFQGSTITTTTITGNTALNNAGANGGGIDASAEFTGDLLLLNDTINANSAGVGGGVFWAATLGSTFSLQNTLIAGNSALIGPDAASNLLFTAAMDGTQPVPPSGSPATGSATLMLSPDQTTLSFGLTFANLESPPMAAHLHNAPAGQNGPIATDVNGDNIELANLPQDTSDTVAPQTFTVNDPFVSQLLQGNIYANVHTAAFPEGEIRGQLALTDGVFADLGGNLIGVSGDGSGNTGFSSPATQTGSPGAPLDALLGPLQNNGGPTIGAAGQTMVLQTEMLQNGSPAIGKGILLGAPASDERGFPSVVNGSINIGATSSASGLGGGAAQTPGEGSFDASAILLFLTSSDKNHLG